MLARMYSPAYVTEHYEADLAGEERSGDVVDEQRAVVEALRKRQRTGARLLDVGCGAGRFIALARDAGLDAEGFELDADTAAMAAKATGLKVHAASLEAIAARYDVVHLADVLEHHPQPTELLRAASALLAPAGVLIARGPLEANRHVFLTVMRARQRVLGRREFEAPPWHLVHFTLAGWHALIRRASLVTQEERVYEVRWPAPDRFEWTPKSVVRAVSMALTRSPIGRQLTLGNRVVSWLGQV